MKIKSNTILLIIIFLLLIIISVIYFADNYDIIITSKGKIKNNNQSNNLSIAELRQNKRYSNKLVYISGHVTKVIDIPLVSDDFYKVTDGTGEIWVVSNSGLPPIRSKVQLFGKIINIGKKFEYIGITMEIFKQIKLNIIE